MTSAITFSPTVGPPTTKITVRGSRFGANEAVTVQFDAVQRANANADPSGAFAATFKVPKNAAPGSHLIKATGQTSSRVATATFTVRTD